MRIWATQDTAMPEREGAPQIEVVAFEPATDIGEEEAVIVNGNIKAVGSKVGKLTIYNTSSGKKLPRRVNWASHAVL